MGTKVFIVNDEEAFLRMVKLSLEDTGAFEVETENRPERVIDAAAGFRPDVTVLNVIMPEMSQQEQAT